MLRALRVDDGVRHAAALRPQDRPRARKAGFLGAFLALLCAAALISACGTLLDTGLRGTIRTERYAANPPDRFLCGSLRRAHP
ncbi:hypothetical protein [Streptomyces sp. NPDC086519]|uniref:hypothetical protein n=1 Tax=Streptomyces sp. NPDC086519 TaxID=3154863 RepID=UPI0034276120